MTPLISTALGLNATPRLRKWGLLFGILAGLTGAAARPALAQQPEEDHAAHHPGAAPVAPKPMPASKRTVAPSKLATAAPVAPPPKMGMMDMMAPATPDGGSAAAAPGCCGAPGQKPFYPALIDLPSLTPDARGFIQREGQARLGAGARQITAAQAELHAALSANNLPAADAALTKVGGGLSQARSGASALQGLGAAQQPARIAETWFKRELNIAGNGDEATGGGLRDLSWLHALLMISLGVAVAAALGLYWARLRRVRSLVQRLTPGATGGPAPSASTGKSPPPAGSAPLVVAKAPIKRAWVGVLRIKAIFDETPSVKTFRLMEPNMGPIPFEFLPGQYATLTSEIEGQKVRRSYTISSSPTQRDYIELTIKREEFGLESRHLHDHADTGDLLEVTAPSGSFFFTGKEARGIVLIAGGVGVTPMMSVLRSLTDRSYEHEIHFLYGAKTPSELIFREECAYLARRHPKVQIVSLVADPDGQDWTGPVGFMTAEFIAASVGDIVSHRIHLCGPLPMMEAVKSALATLKVPPEQIKTEDFAPPKGGPVLEAEPKGSQPDSTESAAAGAAPADAPSAQAKVMFSTSDKSGQLAPDQSVLEAAEALGVVIDFECRVGTCGRCKVQLAEGVVTMEVEDALSPEEKASGVILACQAKSVGDLVVDA